MRVLGDGYWRKRALAAEARNRQLAALAEQAVGRAVAWKTESERLSRLISGAVAVLRGATEDRLG